LRYFFPLLLSALSLSADMIVVKSLACPTISTLEKSLLEDLSDTIAFEQYAIVNDCVVVTRGDSVEALGYDPRNSKERYIKILYKKTSKELYMLRSALQVEQGGKKNAIRF